MSSSKDYDVDEKYLFTNMYVK